MAKEYGKTIMYIINYNVYLYKINNGYGNQDNESRDNIMDKR